MSFFEKFFGYVRDSNGNLVPYYDDLGKGAFSDWRHFAWIAVAIILPIVLYQIFKRHKKAGEITILVLAILLFVTRTVNQICRACIGAEVPAWRALPFHLCTVMTFLLPMTMVFNWKKIKPAVYALSMMGGIITVIIGDYFDSAFMTFSTLEGMAAHTLLLCLPIIDIAIGGFKLKFKQSWQPIVGILILLGWAMLANKVFFKDYNTNYMYLERNGLPGNLGGDYYFLIYCAIFLLMWGMIFGIPELYRYLKARKAAKNTLAPAAQAIAAEGAVPEVIAPVVPANETLGDNTDNNAENNNSESETPPENDSEAVATESEANEAPKEE